MALWLFGDNNSIIESSSEPSGKGHLILSCHGLREKAAMKIVQFLHIDLKENISDCLTKHLPHLQLWALIKEYLFYHWTGPAKVVTFHSLRVLNMLQTGSVKLETAWVRSMQCMLNLSPSLRSLSPCICPPQANATWPL
jgi:hypothetical protein